MTAALISNQVMEKLCQSYCQLDANNLKQLSTLSDFVFQINVTGLNITRYIFPHNNGFQIQNHYAGQADTIITGSPFSLLQLTTKQSVFSNSISITGNIDAAQQLQNFIKHFSIDWEEIFAKKMGDIPAHQLNRLLRSGKKNLLQMGQNLQSDLNEYFVEESRTLINPYEMSHFIDHIDDLNDDINRLQARIQRLQKLIIQ